MHLNTHRTNGGGSSEDKLVTLQRDSSKALRYAALQSEAGKKLLQRCGRAPDDISSIVLVEPDACFIKSEAVLKIAQRLDQPFPALAASLMPLPRLVRDAVYDQVHIHPACLRQHLLERTVLSWYIVCFQSQCAHTVTTY